MRSSSSTSRPFYTATRHQPIKVALKPTGSRKRCIATYHTTLQHMVICKQHTLLRLLRLRHMVLTIPEARKLYALPSLLLAIATPEPVNGFPAPAYGDHHTGSTMHPTHVDSAAHSLALYPTVAHRLCDDGYGISRESNDGIESSGSRVQVDAMTRVGRECGFDVCLC